MLDPQRIPAVKRASLLTTMAIMKANYDVNRDFLANFEPFALDCVKHWPVGESVKPERLREQLARRFALPEIPINTAQILRDRLYRDGYLVVREAPGAKTVYEPNPRRLREVADLEATREAALERMEALCSALRAFANGPRASWTDARTERALEAYVQEFSAELALARRSRALAIDARTMRADVAVVHAFVRTVIRKGGRLLDFLEDMVKGSMLVNVIYFQGLGEWKARLPALEAYLDTGVLLRALGLAPSEQAAAAGELVSFARSFDVALRAFRHTVEEMEGILDGVAERIGRAAEPHVRATELIHVNREVLDHLIAERWSAADVHAFAADLPAKLRQLGVQVVEAPARPARPDIDESALEHTLEDVVTGQSLAARRKDVESLVGVHNLRRNRDCRTLEVTPAMFVTSNAAVVRASAGYFGHNGLERRIRHCVSDVSFTTQLWIRRPDRSPGIARKLLVAESCAALALGPPELYERYLKAIEKQQQAGELTEEQVKLLVMRMETREPLLDVTHGDANAVTHETPTVVLERFEETLLKPSERRIDATLESLRTSEGHNRILELQLREQRTATEKTVIERDRTIELLRVLVPGVLLGASAIAAAVGILLLVLMGRARGAIPIGTLVAADAAVGYCAGLLCRGHRPRLHSRRWHVALFLVVVPVGSGAAAWTVGESMAWLGAAVALMATVFGVLYGIYAYRGPLAAAR